MPFVLDASTALQLMLPEPASPATAAVEGRFCAGDLAIVPSLWLLEVTNVLLSSERSGRLAAGGGDALLEALLELPIQVDASLPDPDRWTQRILTLAREQGLTSYDGSYLQLALDHGLPLATEDGALGRAAGRLDVPLLAESTDSASK